MKYQPGLISALLILLVAPLPAKAAESWRMVTTPHFRVISQASDRDTAKWIHEYQQFISATSNALGITPKALPPLTVILFARDKSFTPYKLMRPDGKAAKIAGQFVTMGGVSTIGMALDSEQTETRRTIFHEATHWLASGNQEREPTWYTEGIAEILSTFEQSGNQVSLAKPIDIHLIQLRDFGVLPLKDFLTRVDALQDQDKHDDRYYAQSWAFVHFLTLSGDKTRLELLERFRTLYKTKSGDDTVREVFGDNLATVEREFNHYVRQATYSYATLPATPVAEPPATVPAPPALVEAALGTMALGTGRTELARQHAQRATALEPDLPDGHALLAYLAREGNDHAAVRRHAETALKAGSRDSGIYLMLAESLTRDTTANFQQTLATRVRLYQQAIELNPTRHYTYERLTGDLLFANKPQADDQRLLELGQRLFPNDDWIRAGVATVRSRLGGSDDALRTIQTALRPESSLSTQQRSALLSVRRNLLMQSMDAELEAAQEKYDLAAARTIIARYRQVAGDDTEITAYLQRRDSQFEMSQLVERMNNAIGNRRTPELEQLFDQILAHPAVTPELQTFVENTRRNLK
jgi:tetratricopeptide (TPR) repeat protein